MRASSGLLAGLALALVLSTQVATGTAAATASLPLQDARAAIATLSALRAPNGTFDASMAPLATEAVVAAGLDAAAWPDAAHPVLASLRQPGPTGAGAPPLLVVVRAIEARGLAGHGSPADRAAVEAAFHDGQFGDPLLRNDDLWAIRALRAQGVAATDGLVQAASRGIVQGQDPTGGWSWHLDGAPSSDITGMALETLGEVAALPSQAAANGTRYLAATQAPSGGYGEAPGQGANCDSTVWAIRGLVAIDGNAPPAAWAFIRSLRQADGGFAYQPGQPSNALCSAEVATLLGAWASESRAMVGYGPVGKTAAAPAPTVLLTLMAGAAALWRSRRA